MKSFLKQWLLDAPGIFSREFAGETELRAAAQLPQLDTATTLAVVPGGSLRGRFLVTADRYALHALFTAARVTDGSLDADRDRQLWSGILQQIAESAARTASAEGSDAVSVAIEDATWTHGLPSAAWELRFGETVLLMAFTDETEPVEQKTKEPELNGVSHAAVAAPASDSVPEVKVPPRREAKVNATNVDLLLDVELEASLRFGSREMLLNELLELGAGDVVELNRHVSEPVDLLVGDKIVARGEVVVVNGSFGLRVLEVAEPRKCLESIRCLF